MSRRQMTVLMAENSEHDVRAVQRVWNRSKIDSRLEVVHDGEECLDYLLRRGRFADPQSSPRPSVVLMDLNMPRLDGFEVLRSIRADPSLRRLPVVVLTTSHREEDMARAYDLGANAYLTKPIGMENLTRSLLALNQFWGMVGLPDSEADGQT